MIRKRYQLNWMFECPEAVLTCSILRCKNGINFLAFGGHDKTLYLMDDTINIVDDKAFNGWCRCTFPIDIDGDGCDEILVGAGDGNFMVMKINIEKKKLVGLMRYKASKRINCCTAGDFTRDGNIELIFGSEDKTLRIFDDIRAKEPKFILYYDSWIITCTLSFLKLPDMEDPINGLLVGTRNGLVQLINFQNNMIDIIWQKDFGAKVNDIKVGDVTNDGFNEIIVSTDDPYIKILNSEGDILKEIDTDEGRPLSLLIEDIDGDNAKEIVVGCADGSLKIFHNPNLNSQDFELKWKTKVSTSIKKVCYHMEKDQNLKQIIFGGYDRTIRNITDFEWGKKESLDIPQKIIISEIQERKKEDLIAEIAKIKDIPSNIREQIFTILQEKGHLKELMKDLIDLGYSEDEILDEFALLKTQKSVTYEKVSYPVWSLYEEEISEEMHELTKSEVVVEKQSKPKVQPLVIEKLVEQKKERLQTALESEANKPVSKKKATTGKSLEEVILVYLKEKKVVQSKAIFINDIKAKGFSKPQIEKEIALLKDQGKLLYSRSTPRGWRLKE